MARKDVDLIIKAKNDATKVLDQVSKALEHFSGSAQDADGSASKTESAFGTLGAAINKLQSNLGTLDIGDRLTKELRTAETSLTRMEGRLANTGKEASDLSVELDKASSKTQKYAQRVDESAAALKAQAATVKQAKVDQKALSSAYGQAETAQGKLIARQQKLPGLIQKQSEAVRKAADRYSVLSDRIEQTVTPSKSLQTQFEASARNVERTGSGLRVLEDEYQSLTGELRAAGSALTIFGEMAQNAATNTERQKKALRGLGEDLAAIKGKSRAAAQSQSSLEAQGRKVVASFEKQSAAVEKAESDYVELAVTAGKTDAALSQLADNAVGDLSRNLVQQGIATQKAKTEMFELEGVARSLRTEIGGVGVPTREMATALGFAAQAADEAQIKFLLQEESLDRLGKAYRDVANDITSIGGVQQRFAKEQKQLAANMSQVSTEGLQQRNALRGVSSAAQDAATTQAKLLQKTKSVATATSKAESATTRLAAAYRQFYGDSRKSLSLLQRIRGEVLSLAAAYGGLYAGIEVLQGTVTAYQDLEAIQARLNVANNGDTAGAANDLDFLRRTADRLGVSLGALGTEYSKFAIATQNTNLEGTATRKIFLSVAEAARVNRSSTEEMSGVFRALTQIISKGTVQSEELKQQLGDRLPGALKLFADGIGVTTEKLTEMLEAGEVSADSLLGFSDELDKRFGPQLAESLSSTSAEFGRLGNAAFEAAIKFANGGFIESVTRFAAELTELLQSADFEAFTARASSAFATLIDFLGFAVENFDILIAALTAFLALRLTPLVLSIAGSFRQFSSDVLAASVSVKAMGTSATGAATRLTAVAGAVGRLRVALMALLSTTGVGLLVAAIGAGVALWATEADSATEALNTHRKIVGDVKNAYDAAGGSVEAWRKNIEDLTKTEADKNLRDLQDSLGAVEKAFASAVLKGGDSNLAIGLGISGLTGVTKAYEDAAYSLFKAYKNGSIEAADLVDQIDDLNETFNDGSDVNSEYGSQLVAAGREIENFSGAVDEAEKILTAVKGTTEDAEAALKDLNGTVETSAAELESASEKSEKFEKSLDAIAAKVPELKAELDLLGEVNAIDSLLKDSIALATSMNDVEKAMLLARAAKDELFQGVGQKLGNLAAGDTGLEAAVNLLRKSEGKNGQSVATPYNDPNLDANGNQRGPDIYRAGYGSNEITLADGTIQKVVKGVRVDPVDALRDLERRIRDEFMPLAAQAAGGQRFATFNPQQQAVLTSIAYNYGEIPDRIAGILKTGTDQQIATAIRGLGGDNGGINQRRRNEEASIFLNGGSDESQIAAAAKAKEEEIKAAEKAAELAAKAAEEKAKEREQTAEALADGQFAIEQQVLVNRGKERQAEIEKAMRDAKANDANVTQAELDAIAEQTGKVFDLKQAKEQATTATEDAEAAEKRVNELLTQRQALQSQVELAIKTGDTEQADNLRLKIGEINAELLAAIGNAQNMWAAVGGGAADAAIAKLEVAKLETQNFGAEAGNAYLQWNRVSDLFLNGLTSALDSFAQAVANGESASDAAKDAFLQFASDFLREIATMIIKQAIFNALKAAFGGTPFGAAIGIGVGTAHTGGLIGSKRAGSGNTTRQVSPAMFAGAQRHHSGGIVGLNPNEVPIIAEKGEEMLTRDDPRHMLNGGGKDSVQQAQRAMKIVNAFDAPGFLEAALQTSEGEEIILNVLKANSDSVKAALG